ncbi:TRAP transporter substrate-binding protein [Poseidonocella sp. HB161398]|uniref:TRAP transporter substrate-binding protein n=1 Tax=Poseidonocella sp. HB161398 TaxID=2320855 RepID=UPI00197EA4AC|nr:TRAP transporter substrate-binding protein [Poseidonocella sp. HB161398]
MLFQRIASPVLFSGALLLSALPAAADVTLRLAHNLSQDHVLAKTFEAMAAEVEELSDGEMHIKIYPNGQMGETKDVMAMMQQGAMDMTKGFYGELQAYEPSYFVFTVPYLFQDDAHLERVLHGALMEKLNEASSKKGFFNLAGYATGTRSFYANKPINTPEDLQGVKIRVLPTPTTNRTMELLGASPVPIPFGETYTAIQQGVIDGGENNITTYVSTRQFEVAKVFSEDKHTVVVDFLTISTKSWDRLTDAQKDILLTAARHSEESAREIYQEDVVAARQAVLDAGNEIVEVDPAPFQAAVQPLIDELMADPAKAELIEAVRAEAAE